MNKVFLTGYIASDLELKVTPQGTSVVSFQLAVKRPRTKNEITDFITIVCWRQTAEFVSNYFRKGSGIEISGTLTVRKWEDNSGNSRYSTEVVADEVDFGKRSKNDEPQDNVSQQDVSSGEIGDDDIAYDDVPF